MGIGPMKADGEILNNYGSNRKYMCPMNTKA
jgi:hypothetical protein